MMHAINSRGVLIESFRLSLKLLKVIFHSFFNFHVADVTDADDDDDDGIVVVAMLCF